MSARTIVFFGGYDPAYPRNAIIRKGCRRIGVDIVECRVDPRRKVTTRYPLLLREFARSVPRGRAPIFVPDFRHKDVPLARFLAGVTGRRVVFDPLVSRFETRVLDRGDAAAGSAQAAHNRNIDRLSMRLADLVLADTDAHAAFFRREFGLPAGKVRTLRLGFEDDLFPEAPPRALSGRFEVLFYGSFLPLHGVGTILSAAALLSGKGFRFTIVGDGQTRDEADRLATSIPSAEIEMPGQVPVGRLRDLIRDSDAVLGIFGTTAKARMVVPNKVYQGLASGRPLVTADTPAIREIFAPGTDLLTVPAGDHRALAEALLRLKGDPGLARELAQRGGGLVRRDYNPAGVAERLVSILDEEGLW
jgi:glycosyltransferase involved in cell wall biosynthesis